MLCNHLSSHTYYGQLLCNAPVIVEFMEEHMHVHSCRVTLYVLLADMHHLYKMEYATLYLRTD